MFTQAMTVALDETAQETERWLPVQEVARICCMSTDWIVTRIDDQVLEAPAVGDEKEVGPVVGEGQIGGALVGGAAPARGRRIAYVARFGAASRVLVDGQFGPPHDEVRELALAPGGHHFAYLAVDGGAWRLWIDGAEQPPIDQAHSLGIDDQGRVALVHRQWTQERIASPAGAARFDVVLERSLVLSDDGRHFACLAADRRGERFFIAVDGEARYPLAPGLLGRLFQRSIPELLVGTPDPFAAARTLVAAVLARHLEAAPAPR